MSKVVVDGQAIEDRRQHSPTLVCLHESDWQDVRAMKELLVGIDKKMFHDNGETSIQTSLVKIRASLSSGEKKFAEQDDRLKELEKRPIKILTIMISIFTLISFLSVGLTWFIEKIVAEKQHKELPVRYY